jgi:alkylation response protein AidB-like acyl-CoA dehydrogenase
MLIQLNQKQLKLQNELQEYFEALITPSLRAELSQPEYFRRWRTRIKKAMRTMGSDGWIGLSWKKEFGGKELSPIEQYIFVETVMRNWLPLPFFNH